LTILFLSNQKIELGFKNSIFFGIYPEPLFNTIDISVSNLIDNYKTDLNFYLTQTNN